MTAVSRRLTLILALLSLIAAACGGTAATTTTSAPATTTTEEMTDEEEVMGDVLEVAAAEGDLGIFLAALDAAGIMDDFHGGGPFTLFIPTDEAVNGYLDEIPTPQAPRFLD
ncbi:MAG: fasciclin domain-containing protein, partial [Acidimicrobiia bacterium]